ncbi:UNVERIFIED_CONTAM: hypothetical protein Sradi_4375100 [Sesamum radiatum]|uniref:Endonuclease/exonuclease/phosphatase domain-containing protein n=1 Tax=Sesamum radiatum TaxID=300843 RepID=A0AAW2NQD0_SESRA
MFGIEVAPRGRSGGLMLLWEKSQVVQIRSYSDDYIDAEIQGEDGNGKWRFTDFYCNPEVTRRKASWERLVRLSQDSSLPWMCAGDFNEVLFQHEKTGCARPGWQIRDFRNALQQSNFSDIGYEGQTFTWWNRREHPSTVRARLDRACANVRWQMQFPNSRVEHLPLIHSDHCPLLIRFLPNPYVKPEQQKRRFRFEAMWLRSPRCEEVIRSGWGEVQARDPNHTVWEKVRNCRVALLQWEKVDFGNMKRRIKQTEDRIALKQQGLFDDETNREVRILKRQLEEYKSNENMMWQQRSKTEWLCERDRNTKFFHATASSRKKQNEIRRIKDVNGNWCKDKHEIQMFFWDIFATSSPVVVRRAGYLKTC